MLDGSAQRITSGSVFEVCDNVFAWDKSVDHFFLVGAGGSLTLSRTQTVQSARCLFQFRLLSACNDNSCAILDECLSCHFSEPGGSASHKDYMLLKIEELRHCQVRRGRCVRHSGFLMSNIDVDHSIRLVFTLDREGVAGMLVGFKRGGPRQRMVEPGYIDSADNRRRMRRQTS